MAVILKYQLAVGDQLVPMHAGAQVLCVQSQHQIITLWAATNTTRPAVSRHFVVIGTGQTITPGDLYIGTCQTSGGDLVWHVFERP